MLIDFRYSFTDGLISKFAIKSLNIPSYIKRVATLPCEISVCKIAVLNDSVQQTAV